MVNILVISHTGQLSLLSVRARYEHWVPACLADIRVRRGSLSMAGDAPQFWDGFAYEELDAPFWFWKHLYPHTGYSGSKKINTNNLIDGEKHDRGDVTGYRGIFCDSLLGNRVPGSFFSGHPVAQHGLDEWEKSIYATTHRTGEMQIEVS